MGSAMRVKSREEGMGRVGAGSREPELLAHLAVGAKSQEAPLPGARG